MKASQFSNAQKELILKQDADGMPVAQPALTLTEGRSNRMRSKT